MYKNILVPIDMAHIDEGNDIIELAKQHSAEGAKITLLNVVVDIIDRTKETSRGKLEALAEAGGPSVEACIRSGHAYNTILDEAKSSGADLIIIRSHRPGLQDYLLGSTAAKVVRHANCSVLVIR